jgi:transcriptional regulator with XRE-family HTH domain
MNRQLRSIHDPEYVEIVARLRAARRRAGLTQAELAARLGRPQSYVSKVETCERRLDLLETAAICIAVDVCLDAVLPASLRAALASDRRRGHSDEGDS